jgi:hypothetical protein
MDYDKYGELTIWGWFMSFFDFTLRAGAPVYWPIFYWTMFYKIVWVHLEDKDNHITMTLLIISILGGLIFTAISMHSVTLHFRYALNQKNQFKVVREKWEAFVNFFESTQAWTQEFNGKEPQQFTKLRKSIDDYIKVVNRNPIETPLFDANKND